MSNTTTKSFNVVKINTDFTMASTKTNITSGENLMVSLGKIAKWYDATNGFASSSVTIPSITTSSDGTTGNAITNISASNHALTLSKRSFIPLNGSTDISGHLIPSDTSENLGSASYSWNDCYFNYVNTQSLYPMTGSAGGSITSYTSIIPNSTTYDLGSSSKYWGNVYANNLTLSNPLSIANGGTGVTSISALKEALAIESFTTPTRVDDTTIDTLSGTVIFDGTNSPFGESSIDWVGIQIGSLVGNDGDMFQLVTANSSDKKLLFRKNDSGTWSNWERVCFYNELPTIDSSMSSTSTNPVQNKVINTALGNKLDSSTVDSSGSSGTSGWYNCRLYNGKIQYYNTNTTYSTTSSVTSGSSALLTSGGAYTALSAKANSSDLGTAASKSYTTSVTSGSSNLVTSGGVYSALAPVSITSLSSSIGTLSYRIYYNPITLLAYGVIQLTLTQALTANTTYIATKLPTVICPFLPAPCSSFVSGSSTAMSAWIWTNGEVGFRTISSVNNGTKIRLSFAYPING